MSGADAGKLDIGTTGALTFKAKPDYEAPGGANTDNVYEVTVVAGDGNRGTKDVKVTINNEDGTVTLSKTQPRVGVAVKASLTDPDGSISGLTWQWSRSTSKTGTFTAIDDANSDTYTLVGDDATGNAMFLRATASYTDGHGPGKTAMEESANAVAVDTRNRAPLFADQDTETDGVQNEAPERKVEENTEADATDAATDAATDNVGGAVTAPDPNADALTYTLNQSQGEMRRHMG